MRSFVRNWALISIVGLALGCGDDAAGSGASGGGAAGAGGSGNAGPGGGGGAGGGATANECTDGTRAPVEGQGCEALADGFCQKIERCGSPLFEFLYGLPEACRAEASLQCTQLWAQPGDATSLSGYASCAELVVGSACDCDFAQTCELPPGSRPDGASCSSSAQCQGGFCLGATAFESCGQCATRGTQGADCSDVPCAQGLVCGPNDLCQVGLVDGAACSDNTECESRSCNGGTCGPLRGPGDPCGASQGRCDPFQATVCLAGVCTAYEVASPNGACGLVGGELVFCPGHQTCSTPNLAVETGNCAPRGGDGEACEPRDEVYDSTCAPGLRCIGGTCGQPPPEACGG